MDQLIIDIGNTSIKSVLFKRNSFLSVEKHSSEIEFISYVQKEKLNTIHCIISSVRSKQITELISKEFKNSLILNSKTELPIINSYHTPSTLGYDRVTNAVAAFNQFPGENNLIIDIGTCLKFDFINNKNHYLGGSISLGFLMRYNALHNFTDNLPLFKNEVTNQLLGKDTKSSMVSGVYLGMLGEIKQFISNYELIYPKLNIFLTGGDLSYFENEELSQKNSIFADPLLTLKGLKVILDYNEKNK